MHDLGLTHVKQVDTISLIENEEETNMTTVTINLNTVDKVKGFVNTLAPLDGDFDLVSDRYVVDAKSIMGIFSLDLGKPLTLQIHNNEERVLPLLKAYIVE